MNKKLLKSIVCIASGVGIATSIPFTVSSCGSATIELKALPYDVYKIDTNNMFRGFKEEFLNDSTSDLYKDNFKNCNTMEIPDNVKEIVHTDLNTAIPSFITNLTFAKKSNCTSINSCAFQNCSSLTSVTFPKSLNNIEHDVFENCSNLSTITWNSWAGNTVLVTTSFSGVCQTGGTVTVTNPSGHDSDELLQYLLNQGGLPQSWGPTPEKVEIKYNGTEESKNLDTIGRYENPQTTSFSGTFSIIPEKPSSFSWSFNVFYNSDSQAGDYVIWDDWRTWINLEIDNLNQLQVTYISTNASSDIYVKVEVFGVTSDSSKTNTISGFNFRVFC